MDLDMAASNLVDIESNDISDIVFGTLDLLEIITPSRSKEDQIKKCVVNMMECTIISEEISSKEGWTLITHRMNQRKNFKASKRIPSIRSNVYRRAPKRMSMDPSK